MSLATAIIIPKIVEITARMERPARMKASRSRLTLGRLAGGA